MSIYRKISLTLGLLCLPFFTLAIAGPNLKPKPDGLVFQNVIYRDISIKVPLDWTNPTGAQITLVARVYNPDANDKPFLFFVGGGPTFENIHGYSLMGEQHGGESLSALAEEYRIVLFDPRGFGRSTPLDRKNTTMDPALIHRFFSAPAIARDIAQLIAVTAGPDAPFYLAGHSFGGEPIAHYLTQGKGRRPNGVFFLSAAPALFDSQTFFNERMRTQIAMNRKIQTENPELFEKIIKVRDFVAEQLQAPDDSQVLLAGLDTKFVDLADWPQLNHELDNILSVEPGNSERLKNMIGSFVPFHDLMTYVLDWSFQCRISQKDLVASLPKDILRQMEPWMLLEHRALMSSERQRICSPSEQEFMNRSDEKLRNLLVPLDVEQLKRAMEGIPVLALVGVNDVFVPFELLRTSFLKISSSKIHHFELVEGKGTSSDHFFSYKERAWAWAIEKMKELEAEVRAECIGVLAPKET